MLNKPVILLSKDGKVYVKGSNIYEGRYIICCDGLNGISAKFFKPKTIAATYQKRITNITLPYDEASYIIIFSDVRGYGWIIPKVNGVVNVGFGGLNVNPRMVLKRMMKILPWLRNGKTLQEAGAPIPVSGLIDKPISDKLIAIGDIAGSVFPLSGEGIRPSIIMAKYISQAVVNALEHHDDSLISEGFSKFIHEWGYRIKRSLTYLKIYKRMPPQIIKYAISRVNPRILRKILDGEYPTSIMVKFG